MELFSFIKYQLIKGVHISYLHTIILGIYVYFIWEIKQKWINNFLLFNDNTIFNKFECFYEFFLAHKNKMFDIEKILIYKKES